jgi:hypothetical protein
MKSYVRGDFVSHLRGSGGLALSKVKAWEVKTDHAPPTGNPVACWVVRPLANLLNGLPITPGVTPRLAWLHKHSKVRPRSTTSVASPPPLPVTLDKLDMVELFPLQDSTCADPLRILSQAYSFSPSPYPGICSNTASFSFYHPYKKKKKPTISLFHYSISFSFFFFFW